MIEHSRRRARDRSLPALGQFAPRPAAAGPGARSEPLERRVFLASAELVSDIDPTNESSFDDPFAFAVRAGPLVFFGGNEADFGIHNIYGAELWATDGATSRLVKDIRSGPEPSIIAQPTAVGDTLFFTVDNEPGVFGPPRLWRSDGTAEGTHLVAPVNGDQLTAVGDTLYFVNGGIWKSDGTAAGTVRVLAMPLNVRVTDDSLTAAGDTLYFSCTDEAGTELWKSDGTEAGTARVKDIRPGAGSSNPSRLTDVNGTLYFTASGERGLELWKTDGTDAGTVPIRHYTPPPPLPFPLHPQSQSFAAIGDTLYFVTLEEASGYELWKTDGTPEGTARVRDIRPGTASSSPVHLRAAGGLLYFSADDGVHGFEPWRSDGTEAGTALVWDINTAGTSPALASSSPLEFIDLGGFALFVANDGVHGWEVWRTDGTEAGTRLVKDIMPGPLTGSWSRPMRLGDAAVFVANDGPRGNEIWRSDGTEAGTRLLVDHSARGYDSNPADGVVMGNVLLFSAQTRAGGRRLYRSDGTDAGTRVVTTRVGIPNHLTVSGDRTYFIAFGDGGYGLWNTDGTDAGTRLVKPLTYNVYDPVVAMASAKGVVYFVVRHWSTTPSSHALWRSDGTAEGTFLLRNFSTTQQFDLWGGRALTPFREEIYFVAVDPSTGEELWKSDGTLEGTVVVRDINPGTAHTNVRHLASGPDALYFFTGNSPDGAGLWKTDGTPEGTFLVKSLQLDFAYQGPTAMVNAGGTLFMSAGTSEDGPEIWKSDGTEAGTVRLKDLYYGAMGFGVGNLTAVGSHVYFTASDGVPYGPNFRPGDLLWRSDGTPAGTVLVKRMPQIRTQDWIGNGSQLVAVNGALVFSAFTEEAGWSLWTSDGTEAGTVMVPVGDSLGRDEPIPKLFGVVGGDTLLFTAWDRELGSELWRYSAGRPQVTVAGRHVFYNNSAADGNNPAATAADLAAVAPNVRPLRVGEAPAAANVSSYTRGINGVLVEFAGMPPAALTAADFDFRTGRGDNPDAWQAAPPATVTQLPGSTAGARFAFVWADGAIVNTWLRVTVKATAATGLAAPDVFFFGNLVGETADAATPLRVTTADLVATRRASTPAGATAGITNRHDHNRDGRVNALDLAAVRAHLFQTLRPIMPPPPVEPNSATTPSAQLLHSARRLAAKRTDYSATSELT